MGFGLTISKQIVEKLDGEISMKSKFDEGTTFSFSLPILKIGNIQFEEEKHVNFGSALVE